MIIKITLKIGTLPEIKKLVKFATTLIDTDTLEIHVKNSKINFRGRGGYTNNGIVKMSNKSTHLATACLSTQNKYPLKINMFKNEIIFNSWQECLLWLMAHELFHCDQAKHNRPMSEKYACSYASNRLDDYKKHKAGEEV